MNSFFDDVKLFHEVFNLPIGEKPEFTERTDVALRLRLIDEEITELREAHYEVDMAKVADAIADAIYVLCGMAVTYGIPLNAVWAEVQKANMAKATPCDHSSEVGPYCAKCKGRGYTVLYRADGKVQKPEGWTPPNIEGIINAARVQ